VNPVCNGTARHHIFIFLQAGSISYTYMEFGTQVSYHFFTNIAHFTIDFIKYNFS